MSRWYLLNHQAFCFQTWYWIIKQELIWSKYDDVYCICWTADLFATKLGLIIHYHKPECFLEKLDCCVQGQGHSKILKCQWIFVQMISSETLNILLPNFVWWCLIISQIVFQKDWFAFFKVKVTVMDNIIKICLLIYYLNYWSFCNWT